MPLFKKCVVTMVIALFSVGLVAQGSRDGAQDEKNSLPDREIPPIANRAATMSGNLTGGPTYDRIFTSDVDPGCNATSTFSGSGVGVQYMSIAVHTTVASENMIAALNAGGTTISDTVLSLYCEPFDPANADLNLVAYDDDGGSGLLSAFDGSEGATVTSGNTYYLVVSLFSPGSIGGGAFQLDLGGDLAFGEACSVTDFTLNSGSGILSVTAQCDDLDIYRYHNGSYTLILNGISVSGTQTYDVSAYLDSRFVAVAGGGDPATEALAMTIDATVPTLGQWGLIAFLGLLTMTGVYFVRKQRLA